MQDDISWNLVQQAIDRNQMPRINWKPLFGMSLSKAVAKFKASGLDQENTFNTICYEHPELSIESRRRLKIGVCARFGEMDSEQKELNKGKKCPHCGGLL